MQTWRKPRGYSKRIIRPGMPNVRQDLSFLKNSTTLSLLEENPLLHHLLLKEKSRHVCAYWRQQIGCNADVSIRHTIPETGGKEPKPLQLNLMQWRSTVSFLLNHASFGSM
jgi:hypothetical protein